MSDSGTVEHDDRRRLLRALSLSRRFHLYVVGCEDKTAADELCAWLAQELPSLRRMPVELRRLDPYEASASLEPLDPETLIRSVLVPLSASSDTATPQACVHVVDASRAPPHDQPAWARMFARWNEQRNSVAGRARGEVVVLLPEGLKSLFSAVAPDLWSIRSGTYEVRAGSASRANLQGGSSITLGARGRLLVVAAPAPDDTIRLLVSLPHAALWGGEDFVEGWLPWSVSNDLLEPHEHGLRSMPETTRLRREGMSAIARRDFAAAKHAFDALLEAANADVDAPLRTIARADALRLKAAAAVLLDEEGEARALLSAAQRTDPSSPGRGPGLAATSASLERSGLEAFVSWNTGALDSAMDRDLLALDSRYGWDEAVRRMRRFEACRLELAIEMGAVLLATEVELVVQAMWMTGRKRWVDEYWLVFAKDNPPSAEERWSSMADLVRTMAANLQARDGLAALVRVHGASTQARLRAAFVRCSLARGDLERARLHLEDAAQTTIEERLLGEVWSSRANAMYHDAFGLVALTTKDATSARAAYAKAERLIGTWYDRALQRRTVRRAAVAVALGGLAASELAGDEPRSELLRRSVALVAQARALLGEREESDDAVARVLAVAARLQFARLADSVDPSAAATARAEARTWAEPLSRTQVPAWKALAAAP